VSDDVSGWDMFVFCTIVGVVLYTVTLVYSCNMAEVESRRVRYAAVEGR
jgi:hypothetical protein